MVLAHQAENYFFGPTWSRRAPSGAQILRFKRTNALQAYRHKFGSVQPSGINHGGDHFAGSSNLPWTPCTSSSSAFALPMRYKITGPLCLLF